MAVACSARVSFAPIRAWSCCGRDPEQRSSSARSPSALEAAPVGTLLSAGVERSLQEGIAVLHGAGAELVVGDREGGGIGYSRANTLLRVDGATFLQKAEALQTEAFGNASLVVMVDSIDQLCGVIDRLEGNLTGCIYSDTAGSDDQAYRTDRAAASPARGTPAER